MKRGEVGGKFHNQTSTPPLVDGYCWCVFFFCVLYTFEWLEGCQKQLCRVNFSKETHVLILVGLRRKDDKVMGFSWKTPWRFIMKNGFGN